MSGESRRFCHRMVSRKELIHPDVHRTRDCFIFIRNDFMIMLPFVADGKRRHKFLSLQAAVLSWLHLLYFQGSSLERKFVAF